MALISGSLPPQTCYGTPQQLIDLFAQYLSVPTQNVILEGSKTHDFPTSAAGTAQVTTLSVAGASTGDPVLIGLPTTPQAGCVFDGYVASANTVTIRCNYIAAVDPGSQTFRVKVLKVS